MHDDYTNRYIAYLIARLHEQIEDSSTIRILTTYLDFTEDEAKEALVNVKRPEFLAFDDAIGQMLLNAEDSSKQDVYEVLDSDFYIFKTMLNYFNQ